MNAQPSLSNSLGTSEYELKPSASFFSCSSVKLLLARLHNSNRTLERVKRGEAGPFTFPWELQEIARTFRRANSAVTKWRAELESCGAASYDSGSWTLPVPEFLRETRFTLLWWKREKNIKKEEIHTRALARAIMGL